MRKRTQGKALTWVLVVILVILVGFLAGVLYARYWPQWKLSAIKPGYLSNMDSLYLRSIEEELQLDETQREVLESAVEAELAQRKALTLNNVSDSEFVAQLKPVTASAIELVNQALGTRAESLWNLVKDYNKGKSIPLRLTAVKVYFITADPDWGVRAEEHLVVDENKPLRALEAMIAGPEDLSLGRPMPPTTRILGFSVQDGVANVNLSREVITDAHKYCPVSSGGEAMALNAIANTLTEFDAIKNVKLTIEGKNQGEIDGRRIEEFWGHVGLPPVLTRNENVIIP
ncbi:GerMN domain-containing protein [Coprothermobacteraceae bacterium]|nr:GerMN domain-containing protein [Coprothermobacteraceae bacterium]